MAQFKCSLPNAREKENVEVYNLKNKVCQARFKEFTSNTKMLSSCIDDKSDINEVCNRFMKKLNGCIATNFERRRVNKEKDHKEDTLFERMKSLKNRKDDESVNELAKVVEAIAERRSRPPSGASRRNSVCLLKSPA